MYLWAWIYMLFYNHLKYDVYDQIPPRTSLNIWFNPFNPVDQYKTYANSVCRDETVHDQPSYQDLNYLPVY